MAYLVNMLLHDQLKQRLKAGLELQSTANELARIQEPLLQKKLADMAFSQVSEYPQYASHFTSFQLGRITKRVRSKMGIAFEEGDVALFKTTPSVIQPGKFETVAWSYRHAVDTQIAPNSIRPL